MTPNEARCWLTRGPGPLFAAVLDRAESAAFVPNDEGWSLDAGPLGLRIDRTCEQDRPDWHWHILDRTDGDGGAVSDALAEGYAPNAQIGQHRARRAAPPRAQGPGPAPLHRRSAGARMRCPTCTLPLFRPEGLSVWEQTWSPEEMS